MLINGNRYHRALQPTEASPPAPLRMERGVITEIPLHVLQMFSGPSPIISRPKGVTSHTTPLSIRRGVGGEASVNSVCRRPSVGSKRAPKNSVNSVRSVREKTAQQDSSVPFLIEGTFYFSQIYTDGQNTQGFTETLSQQISQNVTANRSLTPCPSPIGEGVITEIPLHALQMFSGPSPIISRPKGVTSHITPLSIRRGAGGEASVNSVCRRPSVGSKRAPKGSVNSVRSVREKNI